MACCIRSTPATVRKAVEAALAQRPAPMRYANTVVDTIPATSQQFSDMNGNAFVLTGLPGH
jgi:hypothetical protein